MLSPYLNSGLSSKWCLLKAKEFNNGLLDDGDKGIVHWVSEILWREFTETFFIIFQKYREISHLLVTQKIFHGEESQEDLEKWKEE